MVIVVFHINGEEVNHSTDEICIIDPALKKESNPYFISLIE